MCVLLCWRGVLLQIVKPAFIYLLLRIVYLITYAAGVNAPVALCRSAVWIIGQVQVASHRCNQSDTERVRALAGV